MGTVRDFATLYKKHYPGTVAFRIRKHAKVLDDYIDNDEKVLYAFCGQKNNKWYDIFSSCVVAVTNRRILIAQKRVLWGSFFTQITPDLYNDFKINSGLIWGKIILDTVKEVVVISNLSKASLDEIETNTMELLINIKNEKKGR